MDELLVKIARAMRSLSASNEPQSEDAKEISRRFFLIVESHPKWTLEQCGILARVQFMKEVLEDHIEYFMCPVCFGTHFGRDTTTENGETVMLNTVRCHDEHGRGCRWHGVWPVPGTTAEEIVEKMR